MKQKIKNLIDITQKMYPQGLSRGLDNDIKQGLLNNTIPEILNARTVYIPSFTFNFYVVDHYCTCMDEEYVYIYSQPYGRNEGEIEGWEEIVFIDDSWYSPKCEDTTHCSTSLYRAPRSDFAIYADKDDGKPVVFPASYSDLSTLNKGRLGVKTLKE